MKRHSRDNALDHMVAVMFEDRSFDNLLGRLYQPGEVVSFEGGSARKWGLLCREVLGDIFPAMR